MLPRVLLGLVLTIVSASAQAIACDDLWLFLSKACKRLEDTYHLGDNELIFSGYSYHLRSTYTSDKLDQLNERTWGAGWARTTQDPDGDTHSVFALGFYDSNRHMQYQLGYAYQTYWGPERGLQAGVGYFAMLVQRPDVARGIPIPGALPMVSLKYRKLTMMATFIPTFRGVNNGSVIYIFGHYDLE